MRFFVLPALLALLIAPSVARAGTIPLEIRLFEDKNASLGAEEVAARLESLPWERVKQAVSSFGYTSSRIWAQFRIPEEAVLHGHNNALLLEIPNANIERIALYRIRGGKVASTALAGMGVPLSLRSSDVLRAGWPAFRISAPRDPADDYLVSIEGRIPLFLPLELREAPDFALHNWAHELWLGFFLGCMTLAFVFNLFIGASLKSRLYLSYSCFVALMAWMCAADAGLTVQILWPESPWWALRELHVVGGITLFFYGQFVRRFLGSARVAPLLDRLLLALIAISSVRSVLALFLLNRPVIMAGITAVSLSNVLVVAIGVQALRRRVPSAKFFLISSATFNIGYVLYVLQVSNVIWLGELMYYAPQVGVMVEVCLLSLALADRIRLGNLELERQKAATVQADKLGALGRMAGEIAHEISNPLAIIHGNAVLIRKESADAKVMEFAGTIENTANRISKLVKGMRALSRDTRRDPFQPVSFDSILQDALALCEDRARQRGVKIVHIETGLVVSCRGSEICQVLVNLLNNSLDAAEGQADPWVRVEARAAGASVEIAVSDSGGGIPREIRARIQEPFFTTKEAGKGMGLGLSISRTIVENHGGRLWLDEVSPHTRFVFTVPSAKEAR